MKNLEWFKAQFKAIFKAKPEVKCNILWDRDGQCECRTCGRAWDFKSCPHYKSRK